MFLLVPFAGSVAQAAMPPAGTVLRVQATATFWTAGANLKETVRSGVSELRVQAVQAMALGGDTWVARAPGTHITVPYSLVNQGNATSSFTASVLNNNGATACAGYTDTTEVANLRVVLDTNGNGIADAAETPLSGPFALKAGQAASLLVLGEVPMSATGGACLTLTAGNPAAGQSESVDTFVSIADNPVLQVVKSAVYNKALTPGSTDVARFTLEAANIGTRPANRTGTAASSAGGQTIEVNGVPVQVVLLRDAIPAGARYQPGSLSVSHANALQLWRLASDPPYHYRSTAPDANAVELAAGFPFDIAVGQALSMGFDVTALPTAGAVIDNVAQIHFGNVNGVTGASVIQSNAAQVPVAGQRLGLALQVAGTQVNMGSSGTPDGTLTYTFSLRVRNDGDAPLHNLQLPHLLQGAGAFGTYTSATVPAVGQYTVVPGSVQVVSSINSTTVAGVNTGYTGAGAQTSLLASQGSGSVLPVAGEFTLQYKVRVNATGRAGVQISSQVAGSGSLNSYSQTTDATDLSTNGSDPDPDGDGNPNNNADPTPITLPDIDAWTRLGDGLKIDKTAADPVRVSPGVYDLTYTITVRNTSTVAASFVRVIDNLACTFNADETILNIQSWSLVSAPQAQQGVLPVNPGYTGNATCNTAQQSSTDATDLPQDPAVVLNDASMTLAPGAFEVYTYTVRATQRTAGLRSQVSNKAWVASTLDNSLAGATVVAASTSTVASLLVDPQGYVYDSITRQPVPGVTVTLTRESCDAGPVPDITSDQVFNGNDGSYTYSGKTMSMVTGADGQYKFYWKVPPVNDICTYSIAVTPPATHRASVLIPAQSGVYNGCTFVVPGMDIPVGIGAGITDWHAQVRTGYSAGHVPASCEALHNNIPLDQSNLAAALLLKKSANKSQAELGDFVDYQLELANRSGTAISNIRFHDVLPSGFGYVPGSSWVGSSQLADPVYQTASGDRRTSLSFNLGALSVANGETIKVRYRLRIGVGAMLDADAVNTAQATATATIAGLDLSSNKDTARVRVSGGVFATQGFAVGKVWADCNRNGLQDDDTEPGIPGVRLFMLDGTRVVTDQFGRWSLYGLKPGTQALRVDLGSLPAGARLALLDNRQSGQPHSRFLDIKNGELVRADFALDGCDAPDLQADIAQRQQAFAKAVDQQLQALVSARLPSESRIVATGDVRGQPASGTVAGSVALPGAAQALAVNQSQPLIDLPAVGAPAVAGRTAGADAAAKAAQRSLSDTLLGPIAALSSVPLEEVIESLPAKAAFLELKNGDTVLSDQINVRVTGPQQSSLRLIVNNTPVPDARVGKKSVVTETGLVAYEYIGVRLQAGDNTLQLQALDEFGNVREALDIRVRAPGQLGRIQILAQDRLAADPLHPAVLKLTLTDAAGVPVTARTAVTLQAQGAQWVTEDLNPAEPGVQIFVENGQAELRLQPPAQQGVVNVNVSAGPLEHRQALTFLPALTPLQGIGVVDGVLDLSKSGRLSLSQPSAANAFERELTGIASEHGKTRASARTAFYFTGAIKGEYLLSAAYDSDKTDKDRLFRDIRPDEFYPVYGDGSVRGYDAQSSGKLYVRIDKNRSYLLLGDFTTASSAEVRQISQYSRSLNGVQHRYQDDNTRVTSFYAETTSTQQVQELPANGLSFYTLNGFNGDIRDGSETVDILVRDRTQPNVVLSSRSLSRMVDYAFDPLTRRLTLVQPVGTYDTAFNPQFIRVSFELDAGGDTHRVMGTDVQIKASDKVQLGVVAVQDDNPLNQRSLQAVTALARTGENTVLSAELAQTRTDLKGTGTAGRATLRHDNGPLKAQAQVVQSDTTFDNISSTVGAGRTELSAQAEYALSEATRLRAEASFSRDDNATGPASERQNIGVSVAHKLNEQVVAEVGVRHGNSSGTTAGGFDTGSVSSTGVGATSVNSLGGLSTTAAQNPENSTTVRARVTARPESVPRLQVFGEVEQDVNHSERHAVTAGASYGLTDKTRVYAQHAFVSSLADVATVNGQNLRNATVLGIDSAYMEGGRLYNEYRAGNQTAAQNATGVRNTLKLGDWRVNGGLEHVRTVGANPVGGTSNTTASQASATTVTLGADWAQGPWRLSSALEQRDASTSEASLYSLAGAWRLGEDLTLLGRLIDTRTQDNTNQGRTLIARQQVGLAWRPAHADRWNILSRYEHRVQDVTAGAGASTDPFGSTLGNTTLGRTDTHIVSTHAHWLIDRQQQLSLRWAGKTTSINDALAPSRYWAHLVHARYTRDLTKDWDMGIQAGYLFGKGGAAQKTLGLELGYQLVPSLWLSAGYNVLGLKDPDLTGQNYTSRGAYIRLRWKFDEAVLQFGRVA
ncbi:MAG: hypothetical protein ACKOXQ_10085, partial [Hydrogenophaga sp.]